jgi:fructosamine-3-kinase
MSAVPWDFVLDSIERAQRAPCTLVSVAPVAGGCINRAVHAQTSTGELFIKFNRAGRLSMFEAEAAGLDEIFASKTVRVPRPLCTGSEGDLAWIAMEWLPLSGERLTRESAARLGTQLAAMHAVQQPAFGWSRDNTIGSTAQINRYETDWVEFWRKHRLQFQLQLAAQRGHGGELQELGERLLERLGDLFGSHRPVPSLLHGDLWGGNAAASPSGEPVIFDPAVYYGDREADIAMTELFGGFPSTFYSAYRAAWPLDPGYSIRREVYNLYHVLNHLNLFGGRYSQQAQDLVRRLLAELR